MDAEMKFKFFTVRKTPMTEGGKQEYAIYSNSQGLRLGFICWYRPWRQWCLIPGRFTDTVWSVGCLDDVKTAIGKIKEEKYEDRRD